MKIQNFICLLPTLYDRLVAAFSNLINFGLTANVPVSTVVTQLRNMNGPSTTQQSTQVF